MGRTTRNPSAEMGCFTLGAYKPESFKRKSLVFVWLYSILLVRSLLHPMDAFAQLPVPSWKLASGRPVQLHPAVVGNSPLAARPNYPRGSWKLAPGRLFQLHLPFVLGLT